MTDRHPPGDTSAEDPWQHAQTLGIAQAQSLRPQAQQGGLRFEAYLLPELAGWLLGLIERGIFVDPSEAVFVILGEHRELEPHADLREELLRRRLQAAVDDPRPGITGEAFLETMRTRFTAPMPEPAVWKRREENP